jgi:anti-anti-sigma regulatory factor
MTAKPMFELRSDPTKNLVRVRYLGHVTAAGLKVFVLRVEETLPGLRAGFTVLTDLSELESMDLDCVPYLTKIMDLCRANGVGTVVRVIPDPTKDIGFNILSLIHLRRGVKIVTCENLAEAERALKS